MPRLWKLSISEMETVVEFFNGDFLAHTHTPQVFPILCLMTHLSKNQLSKDADVLFTINVRLDFWPLSMHETLIVLIVLPLDHVKSYRGPWVIRGLPSALKVKNQPEAGLKHPELHGCRKIHDLKGHVHGVRYPKEE